MLNQVRTLSIMIVACLSATTMAQEKKPWWSPFAVETEASNVRESEAFNDKEPLFKLPKWPTSLNPMASKPKNSGPSMAARMASSSKKMWDNTLDFLNPFNDGEEQRMRDNGYRPQASDTKKSTGALSWFRREKEPEHDSISSVNDFLRQPRPKF